MSGNFDPYLAWLEIPPAEQPPHHYRLLGVPLYEANATVITLAADRQISHLESLEDAEHGSLAQELIKSIDAARTCLLDPKRKANYDTKLKSKTSGGASTIAPKKQVEVVATKDGVEPSTWPEPPQGVWDESPLPNSPLPTLIQPKSAPQPKPAPARAPAASAPRSLPRAKSSAESSAGDDALSFLSGPGGKRPSAVTSSSGSRARPMPPTTSRGRSADPRSVNRADLATDKKPNASRMMAIFVPTIITLLILVVVVGMQVFGGGDEKKANPKQVNNKPKAPHEESFDEIWSKSGLPKGAPAGKQK